MEPTSSLDGRIQRYPYGPLVLSADTDIKALAEVILLRQRACEAKRQPAANAVAPRTYRPEWLDDPKRVERMLDRLHRCDLFSRDAFAPGLPDHGVLLLELAQLAGAFNELIELSNDIEHIATGCASQAIDWIEAELEALGKPVDENGDIEVVS